MSYKLPDPEPDDQDDECGWICACGHYQEDNWHCSQCFREPPWGCPCDGHNEEEYDPDDDYNDPVGSCENCGVNLYPDDDVELCDQCLWYLEQIEAAEDAEGEPSSDGS